MKEKVTPPAETGVAAVKRRHWPVSLFLLFVAVGITVVATFAVQPLDRPVTGGGDTDTYEHVAFQFGRLLEWNPFPQINFGTDLIGYPYGVINAPQSWLPERDYLYTIVRHYFGHGPWLQFYILLGLLVSALGVFFLLRKPFGETRAGLVAFFATFFNFCGLHKYPGHMSLVTVHWTTLNLVADFLMCRSLGQRELPSARFLLMRVLLLLAALGHEMGYIAGFALTSFTLSAIYCGVVFFRGRKRLPSAGELFVRWKNELRGYPGQSIALGSGIAILFFLYVPLYFQILSVFGSFPKVASGTFWTNPIRLAIPWFPLLNPNSHFLSKIGDHAEGMSPGWTLLLLGILGGREIIKRRLAYYLPLLTLFLLCLLYHPVLVPTLKIFPWFSHMRSSGRATLIFPVILGLIFLAVPPRPVLSSAKRTLLFGLIMVMATAEFFTAYVLLPFSGAMRPSDSFLTYIETVKNSPGEAVLDWPVCIKGGNRVPQGYCPFEERVEHIGALQKFHEKKVVSFYFGRLNPMLVESFETRGWRPLLTGLPGKKREGPCFEKAEEKFIKDFLTQNDFAGVNLYVDLLPLSCESEFKNWWGSPAAETMVPVAGRTLFFQKPKAEFFKLDLKGGKEISFEPRGDSLNVELVSAAHPPYGVELTHFNFPKPIHGTQVLPLTQGTASVNFFLSSSRTLNLQLSLKSRLTGQFCALEIGDELLGERAISESQSYDIEKSFRAKGGKNQLLVQCRKNGDWPDVFELYWRKFDLHGFFNPLRLQSFYKDHRHEPAYFTKLEIKEKDEGEAVLSQAEKP